MYQGIVIFKPSDSIPFTNNDVIADIKISDSGLTIDCSYEKAVELAKNKALAIGANALYIYEHKPPTIFGSSCDRIKTKAIFLKNIVPYEKKIYWDPRRTLKIEDFKADTKNRPFEAATSCFFYYDAFGRPIDGYATFTVETYFDCFTSYFIIKEDSSFVLIHEQLHFDITELYARKFVKKVKEKNLIVKDLNVEIKSIVEEIYKELNIYQDEYDSEIYKNAELQNKWIQKVKTELALTEEFKEKKIRISYSLRK